MPARRQHRRGDGLTRKQRAAARRPAPYRPAGIDAPPYVPTEREIDQGWSEHQECERLARAAPPAATPPRRSLRIDIRAVIASVEADFARWRIEAQQRDANERTSKLSEEENR